MILRLGARRLIDIEGNVDGLAHGTKIVQEEVFPAGPVKLQRFRHGVNHTLGTGILGKLAELDTLLNEQIRIGPLGVVPIPFAIAPDEHGGLAIEVTADIGRELLHIVHVEGIHLAHAGTNEVGVDTALFLHEIDEIPLARIVQGAVFIKRSKRGGNAPTDVIRDLHNSLLHLVVGVGLAPGKCGVP